MQQVQDYKRIIAILSYHKDPNPHSRPQPHTPLQKCIDDILSCPTAPYTFLQNYMLQNYSYRLPVLHNISFMSYQPSPLPHTFPPQQRVFILLGKGVSALPSKQQHDPQLLLLLQSMESIYFKLYHSDQLPISQPLLQFLLSYDLPPNYHPILSQPQVYSPFFTTSPSIALITHHPPYKYQPLSIFLRSTLLRLYSPHLALLSHIMTKETFYKGAIIKGVYFVEQGEVEVASKRVVARGWVTNGKCRCTTQAWNFKPVPFFHSLCVHNHLFKQYLNDLRLNGEYPLKWNHILLIEEKQQQQLYRGRELKLPKIYRQELSAEKVREMEKMKHYDNKIQSMCQYKQQFISNNKTPNSFELEEGSRRYRQETKSIERKSSEYTLIMSVLRRLQVQNQVENKKKNININPMVLHHRHKKGKNKSVLQ